MRNVSKLKLIEIHYDDLNSATTLFEAKEISDADYLRVLSRFSDLILHGTIPTDLLTRRKHPRCRQR